MNQEYNQNLRVPPSQSGLRRQLPLNEIQKWGEQNAAQKKRLQASRIKQEMKKSLLKKLAPYLFTGGSTGIGWGIGLSDLFF